MPGVLRELTYILVFRTNIALSHDKNSAGSLLSTLPGVLDWSIDLEDVDRVLRVVTRDNCSGKIIETINGMGFDCSELD